jgi:hypothetical protein
LHRVDHMKRELTPHSEERVVSVFGYESSNITIINGEPKIDYYFKHESGVTYSCIADTLKDCRERCNKFLALKGLS